MENLKAELRVQKINVRNLENNNNFSETYQQIKSEIEELKKDIIKKEFASNEFSSYIYQTSFKDKQCVFCKSNLSDKHIGKIKESQECI